MFSKDLLDVQRRKGNIEPKYLRDFDLAGELIQLFHANMGKKYKEFKEKREEMEGTSYKLVRGLCTLLERRCKFSSSSKLNGKEVRTFLYERGFILTEDERSKLLNQTATHFHVSPIDIEEAFFSDLQEEQILSNFNPLTPEELVRQYNLSQIQTLLFNALELTFKCEGNFQQIFRQIKYLGLMYEIEDEVQVTGPAALFKKTKKYGTSFAKLVPLIITAPTWKLSAKIEVKVDSEPRIFAFAINSESDVLLPEMEETPVHFDSEVETKFYNDFKALKSGWEIKREPGLVKAGSYVVIPDFGFSKWGLEHYLEIIGFWTPTYLKNKLAKLKKASRPIIVVVNESLRCTKEDFKGTVIFYSKLIPITPILEILRVLEDKQIKSELNQIGSIEISEEIIPLTVKAQELHILPETLARIPIPDYFIISEQLVSKRFLEKLNNEFQNMTIEQVEKILQNYNLTLQALEYIGYKIVWKGLKPIRITQKKP